MVDPQAFWQAHQRFLHTPLTTETPHPDTTELSELANTNCGKALSLLNQIDRQVIQALPMDHIIEQQERLQQTLRQGGRIILLGCGASGRMSVWLGYWWRKHYPEYAEQMVDLIAGGDYALVRSIESFEDQPDFARKQLQQIQLSHRDLLIATSASGESPFIHAALQYAATLCDAKPWFIVCNPVEELKARNAQHPAHSADIDTIDLSVGPMALTGSTRMQATTAMQLWLGWVLFPRQVSGSLAGTKVGSSREVPDQVRDDNFGVRDDNLGVRDNNFGARDDDLKNCHPELVSGSPTDTHKTSGMNQVIEWHQTFTQQLDGLPELITAEATACQQQQFPITYVTQPDLALCVLSDTTERTPTFNLPAFAHSHSQTDIPAWYQLRVHPRCHQAWPNILGRTPYALNWPQIPQTSTAQLSGFDFSSTYDNPKLSIYSAKNQLSLQWNETEPLRINLPDNCPEWLMQIFLRCLLNNHSTLVMGKLGYYQGNLMTSLQPTNHKLIDRSVRYIQYMHTQKYGQSLDYRVAAERVFAQLSSLEPGESIVDKCLQEQP